MFKKNIKGQYGYLENKRKRVIAVTVLFFALSLGIILAGYITTGTKKNLLTVVGVLGCLPACKSAVSMIMYLRAKGCSLESYEKIEAHIGKLNGIYDMYFTSYKENYSISHMTIFGNVIIGFAEDSKTKLTEGCNHLVSLLKGAGHSKVTVTLVNDIERYLSMLDNMNGEEDSNDTSKEEEICVSLYEISL